MISVARFDHPRITCSTTLVIFQGWGRNVSGAGVRQNVCTTQSLPIAQNQTCRSRLQMTNLSTNKER